MAIIKVKKNKKGGFRYLENACYYIYDPEKAIDLSGNGVNPYSPDSCYRQMMAVKKYYRKMSMNPLVHFIIGYNIASVPDSETACRYTREIAELYQGEFQTLQCMHRKDKDYPWFHAHILVNSVSFVDGRMFSTDYKKLEELSKKVADVTKTKSCIEFWDPKKDEAYRKRKAEQK